VSLDSPRLILQTLTLRHEKQ